MGWIPAIPDERNVLLLLCHERFNEASLAENKQGNKDHSNEPPELYN
jgi:hypothetical protein